MNAAAWTGAKVESKDLPRFKDLLLRTCGHSFENEREQTLAASLCRRMTTCGVDDHEAYFSLLLRDSEELHRLTELLTVNETYFFREPDHLNLVVDKLLPEFLSTRKHGQVRILSAGCSTGEEPYSIAIMLREKYGADSERLFAIAAVDIDSVAIAGAKQGIYGNASFRSMDKVILDRYFDESGQGKYQVKNSIRKHVEFEVVNLLGATYPNKMRFPDIILYRNVSIYFPGQVQREIFGRLAELLAEGGCLLVGASETIHHDIGVLSLVKQNSLFFYHKTPKLVFEERRASSRNASGVERSHGGGSQAVAINAAKVEADKKRTRGDHLHKRFQAALHQPRQPDIKGSFDEAIKLAHDKRYDEALAILDAIIEQDDSFEKAYSLKGSLLLSTSRFDEARSVCEVILKRDSLCLEAYLMLGMVARQNGDDDGAFRRFREALYLDANCWLAHFYTAEILFSRRDVKRARSSFEMALKILGNGALHEHGRAFFPLSFNAEQFIVICRHKLSLLKEN